MPRDVSGMAASGAFVAVAWQCGRSIWLMLAISIWSRDWIGWWSLIPITLWLVFMMINPLLFPRPRSTKNWASRGVLGERIWADRSNVDLPEQFRSPGVAN